MSFSLILSLQMSILDLYTDFSKHRLCRFSRPQIQLLSFFNRLLFLSVFHFHFVILKLNYLILEFVQTSITFFVFLYLFMILLALFRYPFALRHIHDLFPFFILILPLLLKFVLVWKYRHQVSFYSRIIFLLLFVCG